MFGQLSLEGLSDFEPTKKSNNKEAKQQKPAAQGQTKSDEKKARQRRLLSQRLVRWQRTPLLRRASCFVRRLFSILKTSR